MCTSPPPGFCYGATLTPRQARGTRIRQPSLSRPEPTAEPVDARLQPHNQTTRTRDIREIAEAFNRLVEAGKVTSIGASNFSPERIRAWLDVCAAEGWAAPVALQPHYNLIVRQKFEQSCAPLVMEAGLAVYPYWALAAGFLTGKYRTAADLEGAARSGMAGPYLTPEGLGVIAVLEDVAKAHDITPAGAALAWLVARGVTAPIASARTREQLPDLVAGLRTTLDPQDVAALDEASSSFA